MDFTVLYSVADVLTQRYLHTSPIVVLAAFALLVAVLVGLYYAYTAYKNKLPEPMIGVQPATKLNKINFYGDSIAFGGYVNADNTAGRISPTPAEKLAKGTGMEVRDYSVNGNTVNTIYKTFFNDGHDGEVTVIEAGINDSTLGKPIEKALERMIQHEHTFGRRVVLTGLSHTDRFPTPNRQAWDEVIARLAAKYQVGFADWNTVYFGSGNESLIDSIHPNDAYSDRLYDRVVNVINVVRR